MMKKVILKLYEKNKLFIHYCCVSFFCTIIMYTLFILINFFSNGMYLLANVISYVTSFTILFLLDRKLFKAFPRRKLEGALQVNNFIVFRVIGLFIDSFLLTVLIESFLIPHVIAKVISSSMTFFYNYFTNKIFVFRNKTI